MSKLKREPHKASIYYRGHGAWWYENAKSIDVFIQPQEGADAVSCRIHIRLLKDWIKRAEAGKEKEK